MARIRFKLRHISIAISVTVLVILSTMTSLHNRTPQHSVSGITLKKLPGDEAEKGHVYQKVKPSVVFKGRTSSTPRLRTDKIHKGHQEIQDSSSKMALRVSIKREIVSSKLPKITESKTSEKIPSSRARSKSHNSISSVMKRPFQKYMMNLSNISLYDDYLKTTMTSNCQNASLFDAIMVVHTAPGNKLKRETFRWLYSDVERTHPYKIKVLFFIGLVKNHTLQSELTNESKEFGDIVQGSFLDSYRNLTYKAIFSYKWMNEHCRGLRLLLRLDDDVFVRVGRFFDVWKSKVGARNKTILCDLKENDPVTRKGKWRIDHSEISEDNYTFQHCLGYFAALTPDLVPPMYEAGRRTSFFWIDDVFMYGFSANKAGAKFVNAYYDMGRTRYERFRDCFLTERTKCKLMAVITKPETFQFLYYLTEDRLKEWEGQASNMLV